MFIIIQDFYKITCTSSFGIHYFWHTKIHKPTSWLNLSYAHVHHHGPCCVIGIHQGREVTAVDFTDVPQVGFTVIGYQRWALLVDIQTTVYTERHTNRFNSWESEALHTNRHKNGRRTQRVFFFCHYHMSNCTGLFLILIRIIVYIHLQTHVNFDLNC